MRGSAEPGGENDGDDLVGADEGGGKGRGDAGGEKDTAAPARAAFRSASSGDPHPDRGDHLPGPTLPAERTGSDRPLSGSPAAWLIRRCHTASPGGRARRVVREEPYRLASALHANERQLTPAQRTVTLARVSLRSSAH